MDGVSEPMEILRNCADAYAEKLNEANLISPEELDGVRSTENWFLPVGADTVPFEADDKMEARWVLGDASVDIWWSRASGRTEAVTSETETDPHATATLEKRTVITERLAVEVFGDEYGDRFVQLVVDGHGHWLQWLNQYDDPVLIALQSASARELWDEEWTDGSNAIGPETYARFGRWVATISTAGDYEVRECETENEAHAVWTEWVDGTVDTEREQNQ